MGRKKPASGAEAAVELKTRAAPVRKTPLRTPLKRAPVNKLLIKSSPGKSGRPRPRPRQTQTAASSGSAASGAAGDPAESAAAAAAAASGAVADPAESADTTSAGGVQQEERDPAQLLASMKQTAIASLWPSETEAPAPAGEGATLSYADYQPGLSELMPQRRAADVLLDLDRQGAPAAGPPQAGKPRPAAAPPQAKQRAAPFKRHACPMCEKVMGSRSDLVKHVRIHTGEKPYHCNFCPARFTQLGSLRAHETRHTGVKPFKCDICERAFSIKERLKVHMRIHTGEKPFHCDLCEKAFARGSQLIQHKRTHTGDKPYTCSYCSMKFAFATNLKLHEKKHSGIKDFECPRCYKGFVRQDALRKHIQSYHENERPMRCPICDKSFKGHLGTHLRVHTQEKPYTCAMCQSAFAQNSQLTVHMRVHTGIKPYGCQVCPQKFAHSTALKVHLRQHTGEKPYRCPLCNHFFNQLPHLKKHLRSIHKREDPYMCGACREFFKTKAERERHVEADHPQYQAGAGGGPEFGKVDSYRTEILEPETMPEIITRGGMAVSKLRGYLAILMKKISTNARLLKFGFGRRLIDDVLKDSLETGGKTPFREGANEVEILRANVQLLLDWTIPREYMEQYRKERKTVEEILEELAS